MKASTSILPLALAIVLGGCGYSQSAHLQGSAASVRSTASPSDGASAWTAPSSSPSDNPPTPAGWKTYVSSRWSYSLDYPANWYNLGNFGAPDTQKYFSNENVGSPMELSQRSVWETIQVQPNSTASCPPSSNTRYAIRQFPTTLGGVATTEYVINMASAGGEASYTISVWAIHRGSCYSLQLQASNASTRDANTGIADQIIASFEFAS